MTAATRARSILNGIVGDYLEDTDNELTIPMSLHRTASGGCGACIRTTTTGTSTVVSSAASSTYAGTTAAANEHRHRSSGRRQRRVCILVHGLTDDETTWTHTGGHGNDDDYGARLRQDLGVTSLYLRYNTGLHVSTNGRKLSVLLESLFRSLSEPNPEIIFICHSMGGLVVRSACLHAAKTTANTNKSSSSWVRAVRHVFYLGTPHHGSPWEKLGNVASYALGAVFPRPYMKLASDVANLRSEGIKDLRFGYVMEEDWMGQEDPDALLDNTKKCEGSELLPWAKHYAITGSVTSRSDHPVSIIIGDGLVRRSSAEGRHRDACLDLNLPSDRIREVAGVGHNGLTSSSEVYEQIREWLLQSCLDDADPHELHQQSEEEEEKEEGEARDGISTDQFDDLLGWQHDCCDSKWARWRGATDLIQAAVNKGATSVEGVQSELTDEVYDVLSALIPPLAPAARVFHSMQDACVGSVYAIIRGVSFGTAEAAKTVFSRLEERAVGMVGAADPNALTH